LSSHALAFMEQLRALSIEPGDEDLTAKSLAALKTKLVEEKATTRNMTLYDIFICDDLKFVIK
jgi:hypothetical protein